MSSSRTNIEKSKRHHRGPLLGIGAVVIFAGLLLLGLMTWTAYQADNPTAESPASVIADE